MTTPKRIIIRQILDSNNLVIADIESTRGDGNCFFRAIARAENHNISSKSENHRAFVLRQLACNSLEAQALDDDDIIYGMIGALDQVSPEQLPNLSKLSGAFNHDNEDEVARLKPLAVKEYIAYMRRSGQYAQNLEFTALQNALGRGIAVINTGNRTKRDSEYIPEPGKKVLPPLVVEYNGVNHYSTLKFRPGKCIADVAVIDVNVRARGLLEKVSHSLTKATLAQSAARDVKAREQAELAKAIELSISQSVTDAKKKVERETPAKTKRDAQADLAKQAAEVARKKPKAKKVMFASGSQLEQVREISARPEKIRPDLTGKSEATDVKPDYVALSMPLVSAKPPKQGFIKSFFMVLFAPVFFVYKVFTYPFRFLTGSSKKEIGYCELGAQGDVPSPVVMQPESTVVNLGEKPELRSRAKPVNIPSTKPDHIREWLIDTDNKSLTR